MLSKKMTAALNAQLAAELYSGYLYMAMSAWLQSEGHPGASKWMSLQTREEVFHASKFHNYVLDRGAQVKLGPIEAPPANWKSPQEVFEAAHAHERKVTSLLGALMTLAKTENDHATELFLGWFITEQVEEEASVLEIAQKYKLASGQGAALFMIDQELGARALSPLVRDGLLGAASAAA